MIEIWTIDLPHGIALSCRSAGERGRPLMLFLHGFPEAAFIWDELLQYFARPEHGGYRCVTPNLRGFERSSAPQEVEAYRPHLLTQDIEALAAAESQDGRVDTLVAHDWGGAPSAGPMATSMPIGWAAWSSSIRPIPAPLRVSCARTRRSRRPAAT